MKLLNHPDFDNNRQSVFYAFGYTEKYSSASTQMIVKSYIEREDHNILVVEWSNYNGGSYTMEAIPNMKRVGEFLGKIILNMSNSGFDIDHFHFVGHSLGGWC